MWTIIVLPHISFICVRTSLKTFISWIISCVQCTLLCQRLTCVLLASCLFLFCSLCLITRYADIKPRIQCCVNKLRNTVLLHGSCPFERRPSSCWLVPRIRQLLHTKPAITESPLEQWKMSDHDVNDLWVLCSLALQSLFVTSIAFFNAAEIPVAT